MSADVATISSPPPLDDPRELAGKLTPEIAGAGLDGTNILHSRSMARA
jgi:hypothetical protein